MTTNHAKILGKRGGKATKKKYGLDHFKEIGKKGAAKRWESKKPTPLAKT